MNIKLANIDFGGTSSPQVPSTDGTYILKATVLNGEVTYEWVPEV